MTVFFPKPHEENFVLSSYFSFLLCRLMFGMDNMVKPPEAKQPAIKNILIFVI